MEITIKKMETPAEFEGKGYVHWKALREAYAGMLDQAYLDRQTMEKCVKMAYQWPDNVLVAKDGDKVIGFVGYGSCRDEDLPGTGEVIALYVLSEYYGKQVGHALMQAALEKLSGYGKIALWVLKGNDRAIRFYEKCGFRFDGTEKPIKLGKEVIERRMVLTR